MSFPWLDRSRAALLAVLVASCQAPGGSVESARFDLGEMIGTWRWLLHTTADGTSTIEDETWQFAPGPTQAELVGRYRRTVEVAAIDRVPFTCAQRPWYRQRAMFDVTVDTTPPRAFRIAETAYRTEPSPCDHAFRTTAAYTATLHGSELVLSFDGGTQTLLHVDAATPDLAADPWLAADIVGAWRWDSSTFDDAGNISDESEWWEITRRSATELDGTYRRRVSVRSRDGKPIACAGAASWSYDDSYVFDVAREEEHWHLTERAVAAGEHPCLRTSPRRVLDEATAEQLGDHVVLEWRGKRRQVLYRAE